MLAKDWMIFRKAVPLALVLAFLASLSCAIFSPSHACCKTPDQVIQSVNVPSEKQVHPCCQKSTVVITSQSLLPSLDDSYFAAPTSYRSVVGWLSLTEAQTEALENRAYLTNNADRYLKLRRLLN